MSIVLDAGALLAVERNDRDMVALLKRERQANRDPLTNGGVVGQVWRGGHGRQASLARFLAGVDVHAIDDGLARRVGVLLGEAGTADVIDAALILLAADGDEVYTSDPGDLVVLAQVARRHVDLIRV